MPKTRHRSWWYSFWHLVLAPLQSWIQPHGHQVVWPPSVLCAFSRCFGSCCEEKESQTSGHNWLPYLLPPSRRYATKARCSFVGQACWPLDLAHPRQWVAVGSWVTNEKVKPSDIQGRNLTHQIEDAAFQYKDFGKNARPETTMPASLLALSSFKIGVYCDADLV